MKAKDMAGLRSKDIQSLKKMVSEAKSEALKLYPEMLSGREKNVRKYKLLRQEIAKILTIIREKEIISTLDTESAEESK